MRTDAPAVTVGPSPYVKARHWPAPMCPTAVRFAKRPTQSRPRNAPQSHSGTEGELCDRTKSAGTSPANARRVLKGRSILSRATAKWTSFVKVLCAHSEVPAVLPDSNCCGATQMTPGSRPSARQPGRWVRAAAARSLAAIGSNDTAIPPGRRDGHALVIHRGRGGLTKDHVSPGWNTCSGRQARTASLSSGRTSLW